MLRDTRAKPDLEVVKVSSFCSTHFHTLDLVIVVLVTVSKLTTLLQQHGKCVSFAGIIATAAPGGVHAEPSLQHPRAPHLPRTPPLPWAPPQ